MLENLVMPKLGLTMSDGTVDTWLKKEGDFVQKGEVICTISSEKLTQDIEAPIDGYLLKVLVPEGETVPCQETIGVVGTIEKIHDINNFKVKKTINSQESKTMSRVLISPIAKKIAIREGIDYKTVVGTGEKNRITRRDIEGIIAQEQKNNEREKSDKKEIKLRKTEKIATGLTGMRKVIAVKLHNSLQNSAQLSLHRKIDITNLIEFRKILKKNMSEDDSKRVLSLNVFLLKAVALALRDFPEINAHYSVEGDYIQKDEINIGVAVALEKGLVVPVIKAVDQLSLEGIASELDRLIEVANKNSLVQEDLSDGTFSITNLGKEGIEYFTPILNSPEIAILGIGKMDFCLHFENDKLVKKAELPVSLTFDHQVVDGAPAATFLNKLAMNLNNPYALFI